MMVSSLIESDRCDVYEYCERFVNDGSPSGYGTAAISERCRPTSLNPRFLLDGVLVPEDERFDFGDPDWLLEDGVDVDLRASFPVHPDMTSRFLERFPATRSCQRSKLAVWPTSSGRTVVLDQNSGVHLKLHYYGTLGRIDRSLPLAKAAAGVEVSQLLQDCASGEAWPEWLHFCPEPACVVVVADELEWGLVVRDAQAVNALDEYVVPLFSVFGRDIHAPDDPPLAVDILRTHGRVAQDRLRSLCLRIQASYFVLCFESGLSAELNAQNILVGLDAEGIPTGHLLMRDLMGYEKDLGLHPELCHKTPVSFSYKRIQRTTNVEYWQQRHSLAYDHKVMYYCIDPLVRLLEDEVGEQLLRDELRDQGSDLSGQLPDDFFPSGALGFRNQDGLLTGERQYLPDVELLGRRARN